MNYINPNYSFSSDTASNRCFNDSKIKELSIDQSSHELTEQSKKNQDEFFNTLQTLRWESIERQRQALNKIHDPNKS